MKYDEKAIFFPAISIATHTTIMKKNWLVNGKSPRFYLNDQSPEDQCFHHPYILTSAGHNYKDVDFMKSIGINDLEKDTDIVFGDSGGFQIGTGELNCDDETLEKLYTWMERNSTVAPIIDVPPWSIRNDTSSLSTSDMDDAIKRTKKNVDYLQKRGFKGEFDWLNVVHGHSYEHRDYWYNHIKDIDVHNGWAIGSLRKNMYVVLMAFSVLMDNDEFSNEERCKLIHFFGLSSTRFMPIMIYLKYKLNQAGYKINVSFDSSYATQNGGWGKYLLYPSSTGFMSYHLSNRLVGQFEDTPLPCKCPVCKGYTHQDILNETALSNDGESLFYNVVQSHNVYMLVEYVDMLHSLIYTGNKDLWATCFKSEQLKTFNVIDKMFEAEAGTAHHVVERNIGLLGNPHKAEQEVESIEDMFGD